MKLRIAQAAAPLMALQIAGCSTNQAAPVATTATPMAAAPAPARSGPYSDVTVAQYRMLAQTSDFFVVNVHVPFEGDLPGTDASIAFDQIQNQLDKLPLSKSARILLYCRSGRMSIIAAESLAKAGYTAVYNLAGGMNAWTAAGHTLAMAQ